MAQLQGDSLHTYLDYVDLDGGLVSVLVRPVGFMLNSYSGDSDILSLECSKCLEFFSELCIKWGSVCGVIVPLLSCGKLHFACDALQACLLVSSFFPRNSCALCSAGVCALHTSLLQCL